jgi:hypothetical protein
VLFLLPAILLTQEIGDSKEDKQREQERIEERRRERIK